MNARDFIRMSLDASKDFAVMMLQDMKDAPLTTPTSKGGNHPLWILGHVVHSEASLLDQVILGKANRFEKWNELFAAGTTPVPEANRYPGMDELFSAWDAVRADTLAHLNSQSEADLDQPSHAREDAPPAFRTIGGCFCAMALHVLFHTGQVSDARRVLGRKPMVM